MANYIPDNGWGGLSKYQLEDHRHMPLFLINKHIPPDNVKFGYTEDTEQLVKSQRNSKGVVVAKKVGEAYDNSTGKRLMKFNNLEWPLMANSDYRWLQEQIEKFYWGDFSAEPWQFARDTNYGILVPSWYINVKVNLIDCGEPYLSSSDPNYVDIPAYQPPYQGDSQWPSGY